MKRFWIVMILVLALAGCGNNNEASTFRTFPNYVELISVASDTRMFEDFVSVEHCLGVQADASKIGITVWKTENIADVNTSTAYHWDVVYTTNGIDMQEDRMYTSDLTYAFVTLLAPNQTSFESCIGAGTLPSTGENEVPDAEPTWNNVHSNPSWSFPANIEKINSGNPDQRLSEDFKAVASCLENHGISAVAPSFVDIWNVLSVGDSNSDCMYNWDIVYPDAADIEKGRMYTADFSNMLVTMATGTIGGYQECRTINNF